MATINASTNERIFQLKAWGGLHENPDGDTKLKLGEAAAMRNFRITRDGNLQRRPGSKTVVDLTTLGIDQSAIRGMWVGNVAGQEEFVVCCGGVVWRLSEGEKKFEAERIGAMNTDVEVHMFGFSRNLYFINGSEYKVWDGETFEDVGAYRPLVTITVPPAGGGETLEQVNKLTGERRSWFSPDGEGTVFTLPEKGMTSIDYVTDLATGKAYAATWAADTAAGTVTFETAPPRGTNTIEIGWTMPTNFRSQILAMRYGELFDGSQDTRIFLYGDGSNKAFYSGLDYDGQPRADYFPDLNEVSVGDANTPITALIRHYSKLICFKSSSTWSIDYGSITLADGLIAPAFYCTPTNRTIGNVPLGQVRLVLNGPYTLNGNDLYEWRNNSSYSSNLSTDERQAKRISDRIYSTLESFDFERCYCYDDNDNQEYYICYDGKALVQNYAADAWYYYTDFDAVCMINFHGELYYGTADGKIKHFSAEYRTNDREAIDAYWESGSMSFGQDYTRKYSAQLWVGIKPESSGEVYVTVQTDRKSQHTEKVVASSLATFAHANFARWSFATNRKPQMTRLKIKAKKFVFYKLVFTSNTADTTTTILAADIRVRYTGYVK